ncbi:SMC-Scp complex subunit ScpB [Candidatus Woesearchaeota archaeon]|nr:SMC-Scp complex subunit ScpB [Candidatus Woesearchaeota archaeon]
MSELKNSLEALLFAVGKKISIEEIARIIEEENKTKIKRALNDLKKWYEDNSKVLMIIEEGDDWKLTVREKYITIVRKIVADTELTKAVLETLSVIAWKAPVMQSEIVDIRGSSAYDHISELVKNGFISKEKLARSFILKLTQRFFDYFDLEGTHDIKEVFKEIKRKGAEQKKVNQFEPETKSKIKAEKLGALEVFDEPQPEYLRDSQNSAEQDDDLEKLGDLDVFDENGNKITNPDRENKQGNLSEMKEEASVDTSEEDLPDNNDIDDDSKDESDNKSDDDEPDDDSDNEDESDSKDESNDDSEDDFENDSDSEAESVDDKSEKGSHESDSEDESDDDEPDEDSDESDNDEVSGHVTGGASGDDSDDQLTDLLGESSEGIKADNIEVGHEDTQESDIEHEDTEEEDLDEQEIEDENVDNEEIDKSEINGQKDSDDQDEDDPDDIFDEPEMNLDDIEIPQMGRKNIVRSEDDLDEEIVKEHHLDPELEKVLDDDTVSKNTKNQSSKESSFDESLL